MKTKKLRYVGIAVVVSVLLVAVSTAMGQEPEPPGEDGGTPVVPLPEEGLVEEPEFILAQPPYTMNYQGYLTDGSGNPLNGTYNLRFRLYDAASGGNSEWGPETHNNVQVTNGIFQVALGSNLPLEPNIFDEALFLAVQVNGTWIGRRPLRSVPYAFGLVPGAEVQGNPTGSSYGLSVYNTGTGNTDSGIYARGYDLGVYALGVNDAGLFARSTNHPYAIRSANAIYSSEGYAGPDTYIWVPAQNAVIDYSNQDNDVHLAPGSYGEMRVEAGPTVKDFVPVVLHVPIQVERPYGRDYLLKRAVAYYKVDSSAILYSAFIRGRDFSNGLSRTIGTNYTDGASTSFASYTIDATDYYTITSDQAPTSLDLVIFLYNFNSTFYLYGVRLELDSTY